MGNRYLIHGGLIEKFIDKENNTWIQEKKCNRCGKCCKEIDCEHLKIMDNRIAECGNLTDRSLKCITIPLPKDEKEFKKKFDCSIRWKKVN